MDARKKFTLFTSSSWRILHCDAIMLFNMTTDLNYLKFDFKLYLNGELGMTTELAFGE